MLKNDNVICKKIDEKLIENILNKEGHHYTVNKTYILKLQSQLSKEEEIIELTAY